jgi:TonB-dependent SusC/RagA subfamily outer membrane receptor
MKNFCVYDSRGDGYSRLRKILLTMKLSVFLFLLGILSVQANEMFSQTSLNIQLEKASLEEVLEEIQEQTDYGFIYDYEYVKEYDAIDVDFNNASMDAVLYELLKETNLDYRLEEKMIVLFPREIVRSKSSEKKMVTEQEEKKVQGKVTDDQGIPLPGVSVVIKGTNVGVATNIDGEYTLKFEEENVILVFSFVGMNTKEVTYLGQQTLNVVLVSDATQMNEVVVTGFQEISRERTAGSFSVIKSEDLALQHMPSSLDLLEGKIGGLTIYDGAITIRGTSSFNSAQPLVVVDGFPMEQGAAKVLKNINTNDIKSLTVLKDAASTSIYGARAANGVIVITTKSANKKGLEVDFSANVIFDQIPDYKYQKLASASDVVDYEFGYIQTKMDYYNITDFNDYFNRYCQWNRSPSGILLALKDKADGKLTINSKEQFRIQLLLQGTEGSFEQVPVTIDSEQVE